MAQTTQIVPKFPFPYVEMHVNDYTVVQNDVVAEDTVEPASIQAYAFLSGKGIDNTWIKKTSRSSAEKMFGKSNYKKYGQPYMQALNVVDQDSSHVWMMRVMPSDATYANAIVCVGYKIKEEDDTKSFDVCYFTKSLDSKISTVDDLNKYFKKEDGYDFIPEQINGYTVLPLFLIRYTGRGKCGNNYSVRIVPAPTYEKNYGIVFYNFQCIDSEFGIDCDANYVAGITPSINYGNTVATQIDDILTYAKEGDVPVYITTNDDNIDTVFEAYQKFVNDNNFTNDEKKLVKEMTVDKFNIISGLQVNSTVELPGFTVSKIKAETEGWFPVDFSSIKGIELLNGDDGTIATDGPSGNPPVANSLTDLYLKAYNGTFDRRILSPSRMKIKSFWDANYPLEVKKGLSDLVIARGDARCQLDIGINNSLSLDTLLSVQKDYDWLDDHQVSIDIHNYDVKDPNTQKKVPVTISYLLSAGFVEHVRTKGYHVPYVRENCKLNGHVKNSLRPVIDDSDSELKTQLYNSRLNYFESIDEDEFVRACQNTTQKEVSDLLEENDSRILLEISNFCYKRVGKHLYNFADSTVRSDFMDVTNELLREEFGPKVKSLGVYFAVSKYESEHSIIHLYLQVTFFGLDKQAIVEIDLNKRQFDNDIE